MTEVFHALLWVDHFALWAIDSDVKIYTRTGDEGDTGLFGGKRVRKDHARVEAYGEVDELNSVVGLLRAEISALAKDGVNVDDVDAMLKHIQSELFDLGAELASVGGKGTAAPLLEKEAVVRLESHIDAFDLELEPLTTFVLPGGCIAAAVAHLARTTCRRGERRLVSLSEEVEIRPVVLRYVNRMSDFFFALARLLNARSGVPDVPWAPRDKADV